MRRSKLTTFPRWMTPYIFCIWFLILWGGPVAPASEPVFDMAAIQDANTLDIEVLQNWHSVEGLSATRQKLVTINVGDLWEGQQYRIPVRMVVPANQKATGFHLTGGSTPSRLKRDTKPNQLERELLKSGVGPCIHGRPRTGKLWSTCARRGCQQTICRDTQSSLQDSVLGMASNFNAGNHNSLRRDRSLRERKSCSHGCIKKRRVTLDGDTA